MIASRKKFNKENYWKCFKWTKETIGESFFLLFEDKQLFEEEFYHNQVFSSLLIEYLLNLFIKKEKREIPDTLYNNFIKSDRKEFNLLYPKKIEDVFVVYYKFFFEDILIKKTQTNSLELYSLPLEAVRIACQGAPCYKSDTQSNVGTPHPNNNILLYIWKAALIKIKACLSYSFPSVDMGLGTDSLIPFPIENNYKTLCTFLIDRPYRDRLKPFLDINDFSMVLPFEWKNENNFFSLERSVNDLRPMSSVLIERMNNQLQVADKNDVIFLYLYFGEVQQESCKWVFYMRDGSKIFLDAIEGFLEYAVTKIYRNGNWEDIADNKKRSVVCIIEYNTENDRKQHIEFNDYTLKKDRYPDLGERISLFSWIKEHVPCSLNNMNNIVKNNAILITSCKSFTVKKRLFEKENIKDYPIVSYYFLKQLVRSGFNNKRKIYVEQKDNTGFPYYMPINWVEMKNLLFKKLLGISFNPRGISFQLPMHMDHVYKEVFAPLSSCSLFFRNISTLKESVSLSVDNKNKGVFSVPMGAYNGICVGDKIVFVDYSVEHKSFYQVAFATVFSTSSTSSEISIDKYQSLSGELYQKGDVISTKFSSQIFLHLNKCKIIPLENNFDQYKNKYGESIEMDRFSYRQKKFLYWKDRIMDNLVFSSLESRSSPIDIYLLVMKPKIMDKNNSLAPINEDSVKFYSNTKSMLSMAGVCINSSLTSGENWSIKQVKNRSVLDLEVDDICVFYIQNKDDNNNNHEFLNTLITSENFYFSFQEEKMDLTSDDLNIYTVNSTNSNNDDDESFIFDSYNNIRFLYATRLLGRPSIQIKETIHLFFSLDSSWKGEYLSFMQHQCIKPKWGVKNHKPKSYLQHITLNVTPKQSLN